MANLSVENLNRIVQTGDAESLMGGAGPSRLAETRGGSELQSQGDKSFADVLGRSVEKVNEMQAEANTAISELIAGRTKNIHETMLTIERADTSLKLMMQVRNKILDAYREIMRMQV